MYSASKRKINVIVGNIEPVEKNGICILQKIQLCGTTSMSKHGLSTV